MYGSGRIIPALIIFVGLMTFPIWYNAGKAQQPPVLVLPTEHTECVRDAQYMRESHMVLLHEWRDDILRKSGPRSGVTASGMQYQRSLQQGCMSCHYDKKNFCDQCHDYTAVVPDCWACHLEPTKEAI
ncbi:sulfate reduction electron transfer complex DsrMKJOP subunit DsrJ [Desulfurivibrio alkaliphilus]|uniref:Uncharacterized protein n=1 Tax=Desulfurivibrio alkaliphilus (strain DSM 19089 / UNIQEM U267 / AHT2) TaxID=589865 RepID=D6Z6X8_DESAT|nr:sulfate reduction electron transfer complex DsrMKJOP subunit DsrJ [Desulfurivibrio alkaliphilus]ADH86965.1 conserved hypothetical protein [Desulfurivibrio alkaliphilus AHT 2]